jgi:uncharacterized protein YecT (DUF1311 family)
VKYFGLIILLASSLCCSQDSPEYHACSQNANTQHEMHACASEEARRADAELNKVYKLVLSKVRDNALATTKIRAAQRAWLVYRDAYIEATYPAKDKQAEYGSMFPMEVDLLAAKLTRQQTAALRELLSRYEPQ